MEEFHIICHCASNDCSNCPMKNIGTSGILAELDFFHKNQHQKDEK